MSTRLGAMNIPSDPFERRAWVLYQLARRRLTQAEIARRVGVSRQAVNLALTAPSARIERAIAEAIGVTVEDLFPERYDRTGRRRIRHHGSTRPAACNVKRRGRA